MKTTSSAEMIIGLQELVKNNALFGRGGKLYGIREGIVAIGPSLVHALGDNPLDQRIQELEGTKKKAHQKMLASIQNLSEVDNELAVATLENEYANHICLCFGHIKGVWNQLRDLTGEVNDNWRKSKMRATIISVANSSIEEYKSIGKELGINLGSTTFSYKEKDPGRPQIFFGTENILDY